MPMTLLLLMVFEISVAMAIGLNFDVRFTPDAWAAATASNPAVVKVSEIPLPRPAFQSVRPVIEGHTLTCGSLDAASSFGSVANKAANQDGLIV
jgi:hypothetical protein